MSGDQRGWKEQTISERRNLSSLLSQRIVGWQVLSKETQH